MMSSQSSASSSPTQPSTNFIDLLDHDSLENILSYCPNRGCYEIQTMKNVCTSWNLLLSGGVGIGVNNQSTNRTITSNIKETIRNSKLLERIESTYLPRLHFQILVPIVDDDDELTAVESADNEYATLDDYFKEFSKIFGEECTRRISENELEIDFHLSTITAMVEENQKTLLDEMEGVIDKNIAIPKKEGFYNYLDDNNARPNDEEAYKLFHVVKKEQDQEQKLRQHTPLPTLYSHWKNQPLIDKKMTLNPCRLCKKVILHLRFSSTERSSTIEKRICNETSIYCSERRRKGFIFGNQASDEINFKSGSVVKDFQILYKFMNNFETTSHRTKIIIYHLLRDKLIPKMDEISVDLKSLYDRDTLQYIKGLDVEDQYYFLTVRESIIKKYRDGLLSGRVKFPPISEKKFGFKVGGHIITEFLTYAGLESMNNDQRLQFIKQFFRHVYNSGLLISDQKRQEFFDKFQIDHQSQMFNTTFAEDNAISDTMTIDFERIFFKRERAIIYHHIYTFPSFPSMLLSTIKEETPEDKRLTELTSVGKIDRFYTSTCCMSRLLGCCNCCLITSCWLSTCCCCYAPERDSDIVAATQRLGLPKWLGWVFQGICRYEHKIFPVLDCLNLYGQCEAVWKGTIGLEGRYEELYDKSK